MQHTSRFFSPNFSLALLTLLLGATVPAQDFEDTLTRGGVEFAPTDEVPSVYRIAVALDSDFWVYSALQRVDYTNNESDTLNEVVFHVFPNAPFMLEGSADAKNVIIQSVRVGDHPVSIVERGTLMTVPLATPLRPGDTVPIEIRFKGKLPAIEDGRDMNKMAMEQLMGMLSGDGSASTMGNFGIFGTTGRVGSMALWHPVVAAYDHRGWDEGSPEEMGDFSYFDAADYQVTVRAPKEVRIIGGGIVTGERLDGDSQVVTFTSGRARELTLQVSKDYRSASGEVDGVKINSWYMKEHSATGMDVLGHAMRALRTYNEAFGPYPYKELDVVAAPLLGGVAGVEFPGLCTIASMFYVDDGASAASDPMAMMMGGGYMKDTLEFVVAHEVAHQWWNATVGSDSRSHPFVDEALANYASIVYFREAYGAKKAAEILESQVKLNYHMSRMMGSPDMPVDSPSSEFDGAVQYVATIYGKGALFYLALEEAVGKEAFSRAIQKYYRDHYLRIAEPDGLPMAIKAVSPNHSRQVDALCDRWLNGTHGDEDIGELAMTDMVRMAMQMLDTGGESELSPYLQLMEDSMSLMGGLENLFELLDDTDR